MFKNDRLCYWQVGRVKPRRYYINALTGYVLSGITEGLFIVVLEDYCGGNTHTIGINRGLNISYDCTKTHKIQLNLDNLSKWCGPNRVFNRLCHTAELRDNKIHEKILKWNTNWRPIKEKYYRSFQLIHILNFPSRYRWLFNRFQSNG